MPGPKKRCHFSAASQQCPGKIYLSNLNALRVVLIAPNLGESTICTIQILDDASRISFAVWIVICAEIVDARLLEPFLHDSVRHHHRIAPATVSETEVLLVDQHA